MDNLIKILNFSYNGYLNSKDGLETYDDACEADHGDGQQVGREEAYSKVMKECCKLLIERRM